MSESLKVYDNAPQDFDKYDICLEFPVDPKTNRLNAVGSEVMDRLISLFGSKYIYLFYSEDTSKIFALIRAALKVVKHKAEADGYKLLLDSHVAKERALDGDEEAHVDGFSIPHVEEVSNLEPFEYIYGEYVNSPGVQDLYYRPKDSSHPFPKVIRLKLMTRMLYSMVELTKDCELSLDYLHQGGVIQDYYPVHDTHQLETLRERWLSVCFVPWHQPVVEIKNYFGEKIGYYFLFLGFLSYWFLFPVAIGIAFQILAVYYDDYNRPELPAFAFFIAVWALAMTRHWKEEQQITALKWNMTGVSKHIAEREEVRYDYYGTQVKSSIDGRDTLYFPAAKRVGFYAMSCVFMLATLILALASVIALFYVRSLVREEGSGVADYDQWITPAMLSAQITLANRAIYHIASALTRLENHRLDQDFDFALTAKLFFMQFTNASSSFYYLAFAARFVPKDGSFNGLARHVRGCGPEDCVTTLTVHVLVIVCTQVVCSVAVYYWLPYVARLFYNFRCDAAAWWHALVVIVTDCYVAWSECCAFALNSSIAQCCMQCYDCCINCCCGPPLPAPVPLVRTNIGQGVDRTDGRLLGEGGYGTHTDDSGEDAVRGQEMVARDLDEADDVSDLDFDEAAEEKSNRDPRSPPPPLRSLAELRIGLTARSPPGQSQQQYTNSMRKNQLVAGSSSLHITTLGAEEDSQAGESEPSVEVQVDRAFIRHYKFDQDHQLRRCYARVFLIIALILCFGVLLPGSFVAGALLFRFEVRGKAWQLLMIYKRAFPYEVESIGECWNRVFHGIATIAVLTNAALIAFTMRQFDHWAWSHRLCLFIGIVLTCRVFKAALNGRMSDVPHEVIIQQKRAQFITDKLIRKIPDRKDEELAIEML